MQPGAAELAAARLVAVTTRPYLASMLFALSPVVREGLGTFAVDRRFRLYYDPRCLSDWTTEETAAVLVHEADHLIRDHAGRGGLLIHDGSTRRRWNLAADMEINDDLEDLPLPGGGVHPALYGLPAGQLAELYYAGMVGAPDPHQWCCGGGSGVGGSPEAWELAADDPTPGVDPGEDDLLRQEVAVELRRMVNAGGDVPIGLARWAAAYLQPQIDWRRQMAGAVRGSVAAVAGAVDYRYGRPSRRTGSPIGRAVVLPRLVQPHPRVAVVVDTSASMDVGLLGRVMGEVRGILRSAGVGGGSTLVLSCDTAVRASQEVFTSSAIRLEGGGGTALAPGLDQAARVRPRCDLAIVLTDGFTPWPEERPDGLRTIIGVIGERSGREPRWAQVVEVPR